MTTTPELHELAMDPQAFDTALARLHGNRDHHAATLNAATVKLHELAGDRRSYRNTRTPVWGMSDLEALRDAQRKTAHGDPMAASVLTQRAGFRALVDADDFEIANMDRAYTGWTRFFPSVTKSQPHIHRSLTCRTLHPTTVMTWAPQLSGKTDAEAVAELDEALCSVCFPDAPVALHNYQSRKSQAERDSRAAEKDERDAKRAAKQLAPDEQFKTTGRFSERITTVAACKELIRDAVNQAVEVDYYDRPGAEAEWTGDIESLNRVRRNIRDNLDRMRKNAAEARRVLIAREARHEGWGMTEADIDAMMARKDKSSRREWFR
jgi:hypothetical protein